MPFHQVTMRIHHHLAFVVVLTGGSSGGGPKAPIVPVPAASGPAWEWTFSGGAAWRHVGTLRYAGGSRSQGLALPSFVGGDSLTVPPIGGGDTPAERFYNDGYVRQDAGTPDDGSTWFWGYQDDDQVRGTSLLFGATGARSIRTDRVITSGGPRGDHNLRDTGFEIRADARTPWMVGPFRVGAMIGLGAVSADHSLTFRNHQTTQRRDDYRVEYGDTYELGEVVPPAAPYEGTITGPGPLIPNIPAARSVTPVLVFTDTAVFSNEVRSEFEDTILGITLGPSLVLERDPWDLALAAGLILEFHNYRTRQSERLDLATGASATRFAGWHDHHSGFKFRPGLFAQCTAQYRVGDHWHLGAYVRGEVADKFRVSAGPSRYELDPVGFTIGAEIGSSF